LQHFGAQQEEILGLFLLYYYQILSWVVHKKEGQKDLEWQTFTQP